MILLEKTKELTICAALKSMADSQSKVLTINRNYSSNCTSCNRSRHRRPIYEYALIGLGPFNSVRSEQKSCRKLRIEIEETYHPVCFRC